MKCDIIIPVWNQHEVTKDCINSIIASTRYPYRLILIDNASNATTGEYLKSLTGREGLDVTLITNDSNAGFVRAVNQGLKTSSAPYICIMNNDTIATDGWLSEMVEVAASNPDIGLVNPSSNNIGQDPGSMDIAKYSATLRAFRGEYIEMGACLGFCMLMRREIFEKIGYLDEIFGVGNFDDTDYSRKAEFLGYACVRAKAAYIHHRMSRSFLKTKNFENVFTKNQATFNKRWGKPKRLLYIMTKDHRKLHDWIRDESAKKARFGNWIWLFLKARTPFEMKEHSNIRVFFLPEIFFRQNCIFRILKKKKKFDSIYVDEDNLLGQLKRLRKFHTADVMLMGG